jgi:hypothetical protein
MKPVRTKNSNAVYRGPTIDIGDAWVERVTRKLPDHGLVSIVYMDWLPSPAERAVLAQKGVIRLGIWGMEPIPPVSLEVRPDLDVVDEDPPTIQEVA